MLCHGADGLDVLVLASRLLLAAVLVVAAVSKLADREGSRQAVVAFGVPERLAAAVALLLPLAELTVAALLLPASDRARRRAWSTRTPAAVLGGDRSEPRARPRARLPLLRTAPFGAGRSEARSFVTERLSAVAAFRGRGHAQRERHQCGRWVEELAGRRPRSRGGQRSRRAARGRSHGVHVAAARARATARAGRAMEDTLAEPAYGSRTVPGPGVRPGARHARADIHRGPDSAGAEVTLDDLLAPGPPLLLIFASPQCGPCQELLPQVAEWQAEHAGRLTVAVASDGSPADVRAPRPRL